MIHADGGVYDTLKTAAPHRARVLVRMLAALRTLSRRICHSVTVVGRIKSSTSIGHKMLRKGIGVDEVLDIIGVRVITQDRSDCDRLVNLILVEFPTLQREYDDYIAVPKPNGYQSVHITAITPCGFPVEIQVRTETMHARSERGPGAHRRYKREQVDGGRCEHARAAIQQPGVEASA
jgi:(p)ppGpp synthase/HD superfamily hydrolase